MYNILQCIILQVSADVGKKVPPPTKAKPKPPPVQEPVKKQPVLPPNAAMASNLASVLKEGIVSNLR